MNTELYFLRSSEQFIVKDLLRYAARLDENGGSVDDTPSLEQYHRNYGNYNGDIGVYAIVDHKVAGGAWARMLLNGYGHVDNDTPELMFAVLPEYRSQGLGRLLLEHLFKEASKIYTRLSLSVETDNPAVAFFKELGFEKLEGSEHSGINGAAAYKMVKTLEKSADEDEKKSLEEERFRKSFGF